MSHTELHTGKLRVTSPKMSLEELKAFIDRTEGLYIDDFEERLEEGDTFFQIQQGDWRGELQFIYNNGVLYEVLEHKKMDDSEDINMTQKNEDGIINFTYKFYNGGTCFDEMLENGLNKL